MTTARLEQAFSAALQRVPAFTRRHFSLPGTLRLHLCVFGTDLIAAPVNLFMSAPALFARLTAMLLRGIGLAGIAGRIDRIPFFLPTRTARFLRARIENDLLRADGIEGLLGERDPRAAEAFAERRHRLIEEYLTARTAMAEFSAAITVLLVGFAVYGGLTPGAFTLAPFVADEYVQRQAIEGFWAGSWAGGIWYDHFPERAGWEFKLQTALLIMVAMAFLSTVIGIVVDPLQRWLGLHQRRLRRLVAVLEKQALGDDARDLRLADTFLPRLVDAAETVIIMTRLGP
ncbi:MAG: DUF6635 family protein [Geminicoccaceae bacterium]